MKQMKVLIVDDNRKVRELLRDYLPASVDEVFECEDGDKALESYAKYLPDWVLMDWEMPVMDGIAAAKEIIAEYPHANVCMVTAYGTEELKKEAFDAGVLGFVIKDNLFELEAILISELEH